MTETRRGTQDGPTIRLERGDAADGRGAGLERGTERRVPRIAFNRPCGLRGTSVAAASGEGDLLGRIAISPADLRAREKAAFTLRLDPARHARLKDACAARGRSAQQIVTQALDAFLAAASGPAFEPRPARAAIRTGGF